eukprot:TRINITY_DN1836_c0_g1_i1.p1 TRINITY_DN1836_c0_g1~~TRINITY_DN1836_c0_g1_i1.p1  ORF type:complete len:592 (-),score=103.92 TRINITY_DN1836_c0_g1_i1:123-1670(-)
MRHGLLNAREPEESELQESQLQLFQTSMSIESANKTLATDALGAEVALYSKLLSSSKVYHRVYPPYGRKKRSEDNFTDESTPFAKVKIRRVPILPHNITATAVDVQIATPEIIVSVYLVMYVPLAMGWAYFVHYGCQQKHYLALVPVTLCSFIIGSDLVNQSLSALMEAPMALTAIQAGFMFIATGLWTMAMNIYSSYFPLEEIGDVREEDAPTPGSSTATAAATSAVMVLDSDAYPVSMRRTVSGLWTWLPAGLWFSAYQLINHEVSYYCSLSERTVFLNLCPLFALFVEPLVLPSRVENLVNATFSCKMALLTMAFGALLFSLQYPDFTSEGLKSAALLVAVVVPYRLLQRVLLVDCKKMPATMLCCFDGLLLFIPSAILTVLNEKPSFQFVEAWLHNESIMLMLVLSLFAFIGNHLAVLYLLKVSSATSTLVFQNLANFIVVFEGIVFFSDPVLQEPLVMIGIVCSLLGGVWYAVDQQPARSECGSPEVSPSNRSRGELPEGQGDVPAAPKA